MIIAAIAMLVLAAIALPLAVVGLTRSIGSTVDEDKTNASPSTTSEQR